MSLDADAKKVLLRKIPHGLFICGVAEGDVVNGFTASWVTQGSFEPPLVVMAVRADSTSNGMIQRTSKFSLNVLEPMKQLSAQFHRRFGDLNSSSPGYQQALLHVLLLETSCFRYWGQGTWTDYAQTIFARGKALMGRDAVA